MILDNGLISLTLDPSRASIAALTDKATNLSAQLAPSAGPASGMNAIFKDAVFQIVSTEESATAPSLTLAATASELKLSKTFALKAGARGYEVTLKLENLTASEREVLFGEQFSFSAPFIAASSEIVTSSVSYFDPKEEPVLRMRWPNLADGTDLSRVRCGEGESKKYFLTDFAEGRCRIVTPAAKVALDLTWDAQLLNYCWLTEQPGSIQLAPFSGMPDALEQGHGIVTLEANSSISTHFAVTLDSI